MRLYTLRDVGYEMNVAGERGRLGKKCRPAWQKKSKDRVGVAASARSRKKGRWFSEFAVSVELGG